MKTSDTISKCIHADTQSTIFYKILHYIRNMQLLTKSNIEDIYKMDSNQKMEIIIVYDSIVEHLLQIMDKL